MSEAFAPASISTPSSRRLPLRGSSPATAFSSVVLPAPFGPRITVSPGRTSSDSPRSTAKPP